VIRITLTDGGIATRIIYEFKYAIGDFESFELLRELAQQATSARISLAGVIGPASMVTRR